MTQSMLAKHPWERDRLGRRIKSEPAGFDLKSMLTGADFPCPLDAIFRSGHSGEFETP